MIITNSDGGARGNPGPGAIAVVIRNDTNILTMFSQKIGNNITNNIAEYHALLKALELAKSLTKEVHCILDSELVVKQLLGEYRVKNPHLLELFLKVQKAQDYFDKVKYTHVSRFDKYQQIADSLVNIELDKRD